MRLDDDCSTVKVLTSIPSYVTRDGIFGPGLDFNLGGRGGIAFLISVKYQTYKGHKDDHKATVCKCDFSPITTVSILGLFQKDGNWRCYRGFRRG